MRRALEAATEGMDVPEIAAQTGVGERECNRALGSLRDRGEAVSFHKPGVPHANIWCLPQHEHAARAAAQRLQLEIEGRKVKHRPNPVDSPGPVVRGSPHYGTYGYPATMERIFSGLRPGQYLPAESAIARAYA